MYYGINIFYILVIFLEFIFYEILIFVNFIFLWLIL